MQKWPSFAARPAIWGTMMVEKEVVSNKILTIPNIISFARLCLVPVFVVLIIDGHNTLATFIFALAACTDFIDGQIARRTNCVTKLGQLLDPAVDRALMIAGVVCLMYVGRLPIWVVVFVVARDLYLLCSGALLLKRYKKRVSVIYPGKVATTFLFVGFAGLLLNWPLIDGLGWFDISWLPGFSVGQCSWGIWFVYAGMVISAFVTAYYIKKGYKLKAEALAEEALLAEEDLTQEGQEDSFEIENIENGTETEN